MTSPYLNHAVTDNYIITLPLIPALQLRGFDNDEEDTYVEDWRESSKKVNAQLDADLGKEI